VLAKVKKRQKMFVHLWHQRYRPTDRRTTYGGNTAQLLCGVWGTCASRAV